MTLNSIYWYDYETFGSDPRRDRAAQFAGIRTDEALNIIEDPLLLYCKPGNDFLPSPQACLITGITPQEALARGVNEATFIGQIHKEFSRPNTCVAGYNSLRFDDEMTRQLLYRNFFDPYEREWKDGNSRWDIIDMLRLCAAVRPDGITWPKTEEGIPSFRLEDLTAANGISHADAHDARADVRATIEMARLVLQAQPRLYNYVYNLRRKKNVEQQLGLPGRKPIVHVSAMYPASQGCLAVVAPLCRHPVDKNGVLVYDLRTNPEDWISETAEGIRQRIFTRADDLPDGMARIPVKTLHINRCPVVAPLSILSAEQIDAFQLDLAICEQHLQILNARKDLVIKLRQALEPDHSAEETDPDFMIYSGGFFSEGDRKLMKVVRESSSEQLAMLNLPFRDRRLPQMLFRYRARNYPQTLSDAEQQDWEQFRRSRIDWENWEKFVAELNEAETQCSSKEQQGVLAELKSYAQGLFPTARE